MPELPEVETVCRGLLKQLPGRTISRVKVWRDASIESPSAKEFAKVLVGKRFAHISRRGKYLLFHLDQDCGMVAHLRMSGRLLVVGPKSPKSSHLRVEINLDNGQALHFDDMRVFGRLWYVPSGKSFEDIVETLAILGPEPLESLNATYLAKALERKSQAIKAALLDQTIIAGIGNIYADESLHHSRINPNRSANSLLPDELERLISAIRQVLEKAIVKGGSTLRNYTDANGINGNYQHDAYVYGRKGLACRSCQTLIEQIRLAGRSTCFCPQCQPLKVSRRKR
ncbi:MAG: bifunctional DNA-formamidopyrimidine glycosylase/DNA-(apurinic or apyrimidinic site) lyase [Candidatus Obscuribacterales bacterium]|jgi:formamidopyrimidine-DNA glycosylase|nr:bifunctional DNA-formamidopyrimidine glycosylase/DNA-(apurinic or apyrimidinic site) lyase [Candidatus Obscuribacterales bacterium]